MFKVLSNALQMHRINKSIVLGLHEEGRVAPSFTTINKKLVIRAALFNHRTEESDVASLVSAVIRFGDMLCV